MKSERSHDEWRDRHQKTSREDDDFDLGGDDFVFDRNEYSSDSLRNRSRFAEPYLNGHSNFGSNSRNWSARDYNADQNFGVGSIPFGKEDFKGKGPKGYVRLDGRILEDICENLSLNPYVDAREIEVTVKDGVVDLNGYVLDRRTKKYVEDLVDKISGVKDIQNNLRLKF